MTVYGRSRNPGKIYPRVVRRIQASGGSVTDSGGYRIHAFASSGDFVVANPGWVEYLIVAGGGGGGGRAGGGGGGGGWNGGASAGGSAGGSGIVIIRYPI